MFLTLLGAFQLESATWILVYLLWKFVVLPLHFQQGFCLSAAIISSLVASVAACFMTHVMLCSDVIFYFFSCFSSDMFMLSLPLLSLPGSFLFLYL